MESGATARRRPGDGMSASPAPRAAGRAVPDLRRPVELLRRAAHRLGVAGPLRVLRHAPDRLLHPLRRRRAERAIRERTGDRFLIVCDGNICRSPYAAAVLRRRVRQRGPRPVRVRSVGLAGSGRSSPPTAREVARERGFDLDDHRSRLLGPGDAAWADLVLVMTPRQRRTLTWGHGVAREDVVLLGDLDPGPIRRRAIRDPVLQPAAVFHDVYARLDHCIHHLVGCLEPGDASGGARTETEGAGG